MLPYSPQLTPQKLSILHSSAVTSYEKCGVIERTAVDGEQPAWTCKPISRVHDDGEKLSQERLCDLRVLLGSLSLTTLSLTAERWR